MEAKKLSNWSLVFAAMVLWIVILAPNLVDSVLGIQMSQCSRDTCIAACKKVLREKYLNASCAKPKGATKKLCFCFG
ncbi:hypothetical protein RHGRI_024618 [Rhododendron griersonianum]|uniref:Uncharacterized protein n=1 Tax=Rhododendron griersonianum TaxID=479676 RepID=A0AAV6JD05_9ERIC|nr:hypothetical protein RHGRI_024618 [Rhododendron griersonianum]